MPTIHPTSVVDHGASLAADVAVGPLCYVGPKAVVGAGTRLVSHVAVIGRTTLGKNNTLWPHAALGADPQDLKFQGEETELIVGDNNDIRENATIHPGTANGGGVTRVGDDNLIMVGAHVGHDCIIGNHTVISNTVLLAGHVRVEDHAILAGAAAVHSYVTIGAYSFVGGMTPVHRDVPPFMLFDGDPGKVRKLNTVGLRRHQFSPESIAHLEEAYRLLFKSAAEDGVGKTAEGLARLESAYPDDECITLLVQAIRNSTTGLFGRYREAHRPDNRYKNPVR